VSQYADWASLIGLVISLIGFASAIIGIWKTKSAAEQAKVAAERTNENFQTLDTVSNVSRAITILEELKRLHRTQAWDLCIDRYNEVRNLLIALRSSGTIGEERSISRLQGAIQRMLDLEKQVGAAMANENEAPQIERINEQMSMMSGTLVEIRTELHKRVGVTP
jgi:hypothetical protein